MVRGEGFGAQTETTGEVVFNTAMTGYQEVLTDPSYSGQIVTMTVTAEKASMTPAKALQIAIDGETYEYTEMYPGFRKTAEIEGHAAAVAEMNEQIEESKVHAAAFKATLEKAQKRFAALAKVEERHAKHYQAQLDKVKAAA